MLNIPLATYRVQLHAGFTLDDASAIANYLSALGISHLYVSPYLQAAPGSTHGYDVMDPTKVNTELGGEEAHVRLQQALSEAGLGQVLDIVPNHMAISGPQNVWWWDVLENGPSSPYAGYFDVEWDSSEGRLGNKILLPILGDHYGRVLEIGEVRLSREGDQFRVNYYSHRLPVAPRSLAYIFHRAAERADSDHLSFIADSLDSLPLPTAVDWTSTQKRHRNIKVIRAQLRQLLQEEPKAGAAIDTAINEINADPDELDKFLERQNYRIAFWRTAARDLGYRRFFDINTLVGVRVEDEQVLADTHCLILAWLRDGVLDGVRIDHPDGLRDPEQYLRRLRASAPDAWIVVEKILHPGEPLPATWPVHGTTGYDFLNLLGGIFIDPTAEQPLTDFYTEFTGETADWTYLAREKKHVVMHSLMGSDINRLTELMMQICERHRRFRDYTRFEVNEALREMIACFPVYRTYIRPESDQIRQEDRQVVTTAAECATKHRPEIDPELFAFIRGLLLRDFRGDSESEFIMRFQQVTGPITAKGIEDTAFYCYNRFIALNEVGGNPAHFGYSPEHFHRSMAEAAARRPHAMLSTSTHDTKRSEDARARLWVLTEVPGAWMDVVRRWSAHNEQYRFHDFPDRNTEYLLYQSLVGVWPIDVERATSYMQKTVREAKGHTSWTAPNAEYELAVKNFVSAILNDQEFCRDIDGFVSWITWAGRVNALSQVLIKLTAPGVPDIYQGTELWNLRLVDPDNRRPVNFDMRKKLFSELPSLSPAQILERSDEGLPKLWLTHRALRVRHDYPDVFKSGDYQPLQADGAHADRVVSFVRAATVMTVVPRLTATLNGQWADTSIVLPTGKWHNVLTEDSELSGTIPIGELLRQFPVALLVKSP